MWHRGVRLLPRPPSLTHVDAKSAGTDWSDLKVAQYAASWEFSLALGIDLIFELQPADLWLVFVFFYLIVCSSDFSQILHYAWNTWMDGWNGYWRNWNCVHDIGLCIFCPFDKYKTEQTTSCVTSRGTKTSAFLSRFEILKLFHLFCGTWKPYILLVIKAKGQTGLVNSGNIFISVTNRETLLFNYSDGSKMKKTQIKWERKQNETHTNHSRSITWSSNVFGRTVA